MNKSTCHSTPLSTFGVVSILDIYLYTHTNLYKAQGLDLKVTSQEFFSQEETNFRSSQLTGTDQNQNAY